MRHSVHIMFGKDLSQTLLDCTIHVLKYGESQHSPYFKPILWNYSNEKVIELAAVEINEKDPELFFTLLENKFQPGFLKEEFAEQNSQEELIRYFTVLQQNSINLSNQGTRSQLHYCLYFPLYDTNAWENVQKCINILRNVQLPVEIDLCGFGHELAELVSAGIANDFKGFKKTASEIIKSVLNLKKSTDNPISHFIILQNSQSSGISLNFSGITLGRVIGEFAMICIENYDELFTSVYSSVEFQALGLSVLNLDKYYYVEYLLHKTYLFALEREGIRGPEVITDVDIVMVTNKVQAMLRNKIHILSEFFKREIKSRLINGKNHEIIIQEITPVLRSEMKQLSADLKSFITDLNLSIPEKRAVFSALLGEDDELFENRIFTEFPLWLDDIDTEALQVFIDANNALLKTDDHKGDACLSGNEFPVISPLNEIRELKIEIIQTTGYIRTLEKEIIQLGSQVTNIEDSRKSLLIDGFYEFGGYNYHLLPKIEEKPLTEDYAPHPVKSDAIDLRSGFTTIKNQGQTGACTAYSLTAIYEYILKSNKQQENDLSEAFLYYNARKRNGEENKLSGSRIDLAIESLVEDGICLEEKWPSKFGTDDEILRHYTTEPDQDAKNDALLRRVKKAVNVKRTVDDIKSALEDGYPVVISTTLFDSFGKNPSGVIFYPTQEELEALKTDKSNRGHAMVICGFSEENKVFIVRNSWGIEFGDKGYCYIPYSYITTSEITSYAAAIVEVATFSAKGTVKRTSIPFGDDVKMRYSIKKNAREEENRLLEKLKNRYLILRMEYNALHELILNPHNQTVLTRATSQRLTEEKKKLTDKYNKALEDMEIQLSVFDRQTLRKSIIIGMIFIVLAVLEAIYCFMYNKGIEAEWVEPSGGLFSSVYHYAVFIYITLLALCIICIVFYRQFRFIQRKKLKEELQEICDNCNIAVKNKETELHENKLRMHFAGMILAENSAVEHELSQKYQFMQSFYVNLNTWHDVESDSLNSFREQTPAPFISLLSTSSLDKYFEANCNLLTHNIFLCDVFVQNYELSQEGIGLFQTTLKRKFCSELLASLEDFSIYRYFASPIENMFLSIYPIKRLLSELEAKSSVFIRHTKTPSASKNIYIYTGTEEARYNWQLLSRPHFSQEPSLRSINSPYKLVMTQLEELTFNDLYH